jgi:hypothetical protein
MTYAVLLQGFLKARSSRSQCQSTVLARRTEIRTVNEPQFHDSCFKFAGSPVAMLEFTGAVPHAWTPIMRRPLVKLNNSPHGTTRESS